MPRPRNGGGWAAVQYTLRMARRVGWRQLWNALRSRNACKTCALGMGGQAGGMRNEAGHWPEVCKKSLQAMVADMQSGLQPEFFSRYSLADLRTLTPRELELCGRLTYPLFAGPSDTHYKILTWDEALQRVASQLESTPPNQTFFYASGRSSNEAGFLLQLFARLYGTNYVNNCSYYCHQASSVGLTASVGTGTATVTLEDLDRADLFFLIGGNPASNHPRLMRTCMSMRRRGASIIVINPVKEVGLVRFNVPSDPWSLLFGSRIASLYLQPHIGGDIALLTGIAKVVLETQAVDRTFVEQATTGFAEFKASVEHRSWDSIVAGSGVPRAQIEQAARLYCKARKVVFGWTMGITHHEHGVANVQTIVNLALLRGMVGKIGAGLLPIRGHSNVQGMGSMGVSPKLKQEIFERLEALPGVRLPISPGLDTMACMQAAHQGSMRSAICLGGNLFGGNPDSRFAARALSRLEQVAYLSTSLNTGHAWGRARATLILPVLARDEEPHATTQESMFNYVRLSDGGPSRLQGPRSEIDLVAALAGLVLGLKGPVDWQSVRHACEVRSLIARTITGYEKIEAVDRTRAEFHVGGRTLHTSRFPTSTGKACFVPHPLPVLPRSDNELRLMTVRSEGQFNTVVYEEEDIYRGQDRRNVILMHRQDIERLGLRPNQAVTVRSETGSLSGILVRPFDIKAGNALMYFPEANVLVPTRTDTASKTPAFKSVLVTIEANPGPSSMAYGRRALTLTNPA